MIKFTFTFSSGGILALEGALLLPLPVSAVAISVPTEVVVGGLAEVGLDIYGERTDPTISSMHETGKAGIRAAGSLDITYSRRNTENILRSMVL